MNNQRHSIARGFTIIELLVATAITALLMTLMVTIITGVTKSWSSSSGKLTSGGQARLILDQITKDLQGAIIRSDGNTWMAATVLSDKTTWASGSAKPLTNSDTTDNYSVDLAAVNGQAVASNNKGAIAQARFGVSGVWLRFFTTQPGTNTTGQLDTLSAPVAVSYRLMYGNVTPSASSAKRYMLYRGQVTPTATFAAGYNLDPTSTTLAYPVQSTQPADTDSGTVKTIFWPARSDVLAENVVDFGVRMYVKETVGGTTNLRLVFPAEAVPAQNGGSAVGKPYGTTVAVSNISATDPQTYHYSKSGTTSATDYYANTFPDVIEVMVRVLTSDGVQKLELLENPPAGYTPPETWWQIVEANSTVYTRRIQINAKAF